MNGIIDYQTRIQRMSSPDGKISPNGNTIKSLYDNIPSRFDLYSLRAIMVGGSWETVNTFFKHVVTTMETRSINTPLRRAHFLAQLGHESGSFRYTEEIASGAAYEGRKDLGNTEKGDGQRFKGRGLIQLTGRANYTAYGNAISQNLTVDGNWTKVSTDPVLAADAAGWFWETHNLNTVADTDDIKKITRVVNGGSNGLADRQDYLKRAKWFLVYP
ncbi:glycoside hydrolase family 19 protein [uncultured Thiodictyon sp.]|uniref:glycoside hydrolase family 19 protein n=1 Tax=uncultured Thiodictyon sp. TaxID=1846217 RepID=UPI0025F8E4D4|nr:glycoside hydrolase family 19 protein [uncultured Thiodictyon sp.]